MKLLIEDTLSFTKYAIIDNKELIYIDIIEKNDDARLDDVFIGEVVQIVSGLDAAFVNIGINTGFLPMKNSKAKVGDRIAVQVIKEGNESKKPKLTQDISLRGNYAVLLPNEKNLKIPRNINPEKESVAERIKNAHEGTGLILRTKAFESDYEDINSDICCLKEKYSLFISKNEIGSRISQNDMDSKIDELLNKFMISDILTNDKNYYIINRKKMLTRNMRFECIENYCFNHNGVNVENLIKRKFEFADFSIHIEKTEAMTVIDIDSGYIDNSRLKESHFFEINRKAVFKSLELINLLDIGGIIIIDLINMPQSLRVQLDEYVSDIMKNQKKQMRHSKITKNSLLEIICQKSSMSLIEKLTCSCERCNGTGRAYSDALLLDEFEIALRSKINNTGKKEYAVSVPYDRYERLLGHLVRLEKYFECEFHYEKEYEAIHEIKIK